MTKFLIRIKCSDFKDIEVEADNEDDAIYEAEKKYHCEAKGCEHEETWVL